MNKPKTQTLPNELSNLIAVALDDLQALRKDRNYKIDMGKWHTPTFFKTRHPVCEVCLAGVVMAKRLQARPACEVHPSHYNIATYNKLMALNAARCGCVEQALRGIRQFAPGKRAGMPLRVNIPAFSNKNPRRFYLAMRKLVRELRSRGL